jgi:hypothetical protein
MVLDYALQRQKHQATKFEIVKKEIDLVLGDGKAEL